MRIFFVNFHKVFLFVLISFLIPLYSYADIGFGGSLGRANGTGTSITLSNLEVTGNDRVIVLNIATVGQATVSSLYYDDGAGGGQQAFTQLGGYLDTTGTGYVFSSWYLIAPTTGSGRRIVGTLSGSDTWNLAAVYYNGVDQATPFTTPSEHIQTDESYQIVTDTSNAANSWHLGVFYTFGGGATLFSGGISRESHPTPPTYNGLIVDSNSQIANGGTNTFTFLINASVSASISAMMRPSSDAIAPVFSSVTPASSSTLSNITSTSGIGYTVDEALSAGSITITRTGGTADNNSPHVCTLKGSALSVGAHVIDLSDTTNGCTSDVSNLVDGTIYTFTFTGNDAASNSATPVTRTSVTFDSRDLTLLSNGTDGSNSTIGPGASATEVGRFGFVTNGGNNDTVTGLVVTLSGGASVYTNVATVDVQTAAGASKCLSSSWGSDNIVELTSCNISVTSSPLEYKIMLTPKSHADMPVPPGASYSITATVTDWTGSNLHSGSGDTGSATLTIDNASPAIVSSSSATAYGSEVSIAWTNPVTSDFSEVVVMRRSSSAISDTPVEGTTYIAGNSIGSSDVVYVGNGTTYTDTSVVSGTAYHYKIFSKDTRGNYSATGVVPTGSPATPLDNEYFDGYCPSNATDNTDMDCCENSGGYWRNDICSFTPESINVAVMLWNYQDDTSNTYTRQQIEAQIFTNPNSFNSLVENNSFSKFDISGDVYGYYTVPYNKSQTCGSTADDIQAYVIAAAENDGANMASYDYVWWLPNDAACSDIGALFSGFQPLYALANWATGGKFHEAVHGILGLGNYGIKHTSALNCDDSIIKDDPLNNCEHIEYSYWPDVMGYPWNLNTELWGFNVFHREVLGWLPHRNIKTAEFGETYTIVPSETNRQGIQSLKVMIPGESEQYVLEYRQQSGMDATLPAGLTTGVLIYRRGPSYGFQGEVAGSLHLLDMTPQSLTPDANDDRFDFEDAALNDGETFFDDISGVTITQHSHGSNGAVVSVACTTGYPCDSQSEPLSCAYHYAPVCGLDGNDYTNSCFADFASVEVDCIGSCPCNNNCPTPMCAPAGPGCSYVTDNETRIEGNPHDETGEVDYPGCLKYPCGILTCVAETIPPVVTINSPTSNQEFSSGTLSTTFSLTTNEDAICRWSTVDTAYGNMTNLFTLTGGTTHTTTVPDLVNGTSYTLFTRCQDELLNLNSSSQTVSFSVAAVAASSGGGGGGGGSRRVNQTVGPLIPFISNQPTIAASPTLPFTRNLYKGIVGEDVKRLQETLQKLGFFPLATQTVTYFGNTTEQSVRQFQIKYDIVSSGTSDTTGFGAFGPKTRSKLNQLISGGSPSTIINPTSPSLPFTRNLIKGSNGEDVRLLQLTLQNMGFFPKTITPILYFGNATEQAVRDFQAKYSIVSSGTPESTGFGAFGPKTRSKLNQLISGGSQ